MDNQIIGPFILAKSIITADIYLNIVKHYIVPQLKEFQTWVVFQQEGTSPDWVLMVCDFLNETFTNLWMGRNGPTSWPPRSPNITLLKLFCGVAIVKDREFRTPVRDIETLLSQIINVLATINEKILEKTWHEIEYSLDILRALFPSKAKKVRIC